MIDLKDFGLLGSPQSEECWLWAYWLWVREKIKVDYGFVGFVFWDFLDNGWHVETMGFFIYNPSLLILKVDSSGLK